MHKLNLTKVSKEMARRVGASNVATVHDYRLSKDKMVAKVVVGFTARPANSIEVASLISAAFNNKLSIVEGSFRRINAEKGRMMMVGFVKSNRTIKPYQEKAGSYMVMAANILMDKADESLWEIKDTAGGKMLCRQTEENLSELLEVARVRKVGLASVLCLASTAQPREFAAFVDTTEQRVRYGYIIKSEVEGEQVILPEDDGSPILDVDDEDIIEVAALGDADAKLLGAEAVNMSLEAYYKKLYSWAPEFYTDLKRQIDSHATA